MASFPKKAQRPPVKAERAPVAAQPAPAFDDMDEVEAVEAEAAPELFAAEAAEPVEAPVEVELEIPAVAPAKAAAPVLQAVATDLQQNLRLLVEKGVVESRARYAEVKTAAEVASAAMEASYGAARDGVFAFNARAIEAIKAQAGANLDHFASLAGAKSVSHAVSLQAEFARKWFEGSSERAKELTALARKVADDTAAPFRAHVAKTFHVAR